jgi:hypothetical protein
MLFTCRVPNFSRGIGIHRHDSKSDDQVRPYRAGICRHETGHNDSDDEWLYLPETLYAFMLISVISAGTGPYSLDALIVGLME